jgi:pimeloyl-ACP methyl ester carboxylesterase
MRALLGVVVLLAELRAAGAAALHLPAALRRRGCEGRHLIADDNARMPVVLVHGYAGSDSVWRPLIRALLAERFGHLVSITYNSFAVGPETVAVQVATHARRAMELSGFDTVHLVGHSLGGLIVRNAVESHGLARSTGTAVTIACPHNGTPLARIAPGRCSRAMLPRLRAERLADPAAQRVRWLTYYSDADRIVPASSARLDEPRRRATNVLIPGCGHLTICRDARLVRSVVDELIRTETSRTPAVALAAPQRCLQLAA